MEGFEFGLMMLGVLLVLIAFRMPIAISMIFVGMVGYASISGWGTLFNYLNTSAYWRFSTYDLSVVPMFVLMGNIAARAGLSRDLFRAANAWFGWMSGGVAIAAIFACAGFGSVCGSSLATASTVWASSKMTASYSGMTLTPNCRSARSLKNKA